MSHVVRVIWRSVPRLVAVDVGVRHQVHPGRDVALLILLAATASLVSASPGAALPIHFAIVIFEVYQDGTLLAFAHDWADGAYFVRDLLHHLTSRSLWLVRGARCAQFVCEQSDVAHVVVKGPLGLLYALLAEARGQVVGALAGHRASPLPFLHGIMHFTLQLFYLLALAIDEHLTEVVQFGFLQVVHGRLIDDGRCELYLVDRVALDLAPRLDQHESVAEILLLTRHLGLDALELGRLL